MVEAANILVHGIVQGVGFRPFVYRIAANHQVKGWVLNNVEGVTIHAEGEPDAIDALVMEIDRNAPAAAQVHEILVNPADVEGFEDFQIRCSDDHAAHQVTLVSADLATCDDCARELFDPENRRYRYPFINCTNCGPRFTIIKNLPYDRPATSMGAFPMCPECAQEYVDPADRRFHAQPDACWECGPHLTLWASAQAREALGGEAWETQAAATDSEGVFSLVGEGIGRQASDQLLADVIRMVQAGLIVAVKGLGGFHLMCDADNPQALERLRSRKHRDGKAFAVMLPSAQAALGFCRVSAEETALLQGASHPIVLLRKRPDVLFARGLADGLTELGVMLPYTPVQHLLMHDFVDAGGRMLVMTSGNLHDEPIVTDDGEALSALAGIADAVLGNNRAIVSRYDDSVVRVLDAPDAQVVQVVRRARGLAPVALRVPDFAKPAADQGLFAAGPEQKNTFCLVAGDRAYVSQHIGDMENAETYDAWVDAKDHYQRLFRIEPTQVACDMHPEYLPTKWARQQQLPVTAVQHHHAHIASVLGENNLFGPVLGFAFDGTGYGVDGAIWGGEVLLANPCAFERLANFAYSPMPGGVQAVRHPLRMAYGVLWACDLLEHPYAKTALAPIASQLGLLEQMVEQGINCPNTSSVGRLFDAASALLGICPQPTYQGEGAILLEAAIADAPADNDEDAPARYAIQVVKNTATKESTAQDTSVLLLDPEPTFQALLDDAAAGVHPGVIARRFHNAFVNAIVQMAQVGAMIYGITTVALSGGVFMNRYLMERVLPALQDAGFTVAVNRDLPPNDGCVSYGQAVVVACSQQTEQQ